jgi:hypothetical protein
MGHFRQLEIMSHSSSAFNLLLGTGSRGSQEINLPRARKTACQSWGRSLLLADGAVQTYSSSYIDLDVSRPGIGSRVKLYKSKPLSPSAWRESYMEGV